MTQPAPPANRISYGDRYDAAFVELMGVEGGHVNDAADRGGETKYGISLRFLVAEGAIDRNGDGFGDFDLDMDGDIDGGDIRRLTVDHARDLYHRCFWQRLDAASFARPLGEMLFDQAVNGGIVAARKLLQRAINRVMRRAFLVVDGDIGPKTLAALDQLLKTPGFGMPRIVVAYREEARQRYREIVDAHPSQAKFLKGWLRRADRLGRV